MKSLGAVERWPAGDPSGALCPFALCRWSRDRWGQAPRCLSGLLLLALAHPVRLLASTNDISAQWPACSHAGRMYSHSPSRPPSVHSLAVAPEARGASKTLQLTQIVPAQSCARHVQRQADVLTQTLAAGHRQCSPTRRPRRACGRSLSPAPVRRSRPARWWRRAARR